jgi:hypothetical protein
MLVYNWNFNPLTCYTHHDGLDDVVTTVHWQYSAQSGSLNDSGSFVPTYIAQSIGTESFTFDPSGSTFIPFNELTKDIVLGWITGSMGDDRIAQMSSSLEQQIIDQITPKIVNLSPPWVLYP